MGMHAREPGSGLAISMKRDKLELDSFAPVGIATG